MSFNDKVVVVTGSSSGIGAAIAIKFAELGAKVTIVGRNETKLNNVAKKCNNPLVLVADVTKEDDLKKIVNETVKRLGKLDILVNNAGIGKLTTITQENAMEAYNEVMATNLHSVVHLTHLAVPHIIKTKGNIVNISSIAAYTVAFTAGFPYQTSKAALDHFTRSIASELGSSGVRVNSVNPGPVYTDILENMGIGEPDVFWDRMAEKTALGRYSGPDEIADLVLFLASEKSRGITGSIFVSDNGALVYAS